MAQAFQDLLVWQRAMKMTVCVYEVTRSFPRDEIYGLTSQLRTQLLVAVEMKFGSPEGLAMAQQLSVEVGKMLSSLISTVGAKG